MGKGTNLPNQPPASPADELLAQLAGDEIDKLLAEAEGDGPVVEPPPAGSGALRAPAMPPVVDDDALLKDLEALTREIGQELGEAAPTRDPADAISSAPAVSDGKILPAIESPAEPESLDDSISKQMEDLYAAVNRDTVPQTPSPLRAATKAPASSAPQSSGGDSLDDALASGMDALFKAMNEETAERSANIEQGVAPPPAASDAIDTSASASAGDAVAEQSKGETAGADPAAREVAPAEAPQGEIGSAPQPPTTESAGPVAQRDAAVDASPTFHVEPDVKLLVRMPLYIRLLELANHPFESATDLMRDAAGRIAVLTILNSAVLLIYIFVIRKH